MWAPIKLFRNWWRHYHVPALISLLDFPAHVATATSHFVLPIMALAGTWFGASCFS
ncbi:hypothetical protein [Parafilimonas terrae]|uniref:hypothetical protein n=1 Tax=Parafilimonas terrae TaxID=1465490 RepID=UPI001C434A4C|nr:hypothetical protein [Parafilimonas terrae]